MDIIIDAGDVLIESDRLALKGWEESDLDDFFEYASVDGVGEMAGWPRHTSKDVSKKILDSFITSKNELAIVYKANNKVIGSLGFHPSWANDEKEYADLKVKEIGYALSKDYWGRGLVPEAVKAVIAFCFEERGFDALTCGHFISNNQSKRVIEKCGFSFVKESEFYAKQLDKTFIVKKYILLRENQRALG